MWPFRNKTAPVFLTDTLSGKKAAFAARRPGRVSMYSCGPTVYGPIHIGNLRSFVLADLVARMLMDAGYRVDRVMNITDVGHLVGDGDQGEDKLAVGAAREQSTPEAIAGRYTALFKEHIRKLNIDTEAIAFPRATEYIKEQLAMIKALEAKGYAYRADDGVYFDTEKFPEYGALAGLAAAARRAGARVEVSGGKKSPHDFALWRFAKPGDLQQWDSPWGRGNPGWSIECSAMATALLGPQIDIHTGGEDLAQIHHNNEIAQSECASGKHPFVGTWVHGAFLTMSGEKISKSLGNTFSLEDVIARGIDPRALRYFFLQAHYRTPLSFSWDALAAAAEGRARLARSAQAVMREARESKGSPAADAFAALVRDDLATPQALAFLQESMRDEALSAEQKLGVLRKADVLLGLSLTAPAEEIPEDVRALAEKREEAREKKDFKAADELRIHIRDRGYHVEDGPSGPVLAKIDR